MSSKPLSVIIPVYNLGDDIKHLSKELNRLEKRDVQVIIVDDGSDDGTLDALRAMTPPVEDFLILESPQNRGAGVARNIGFPHATGEYTLFFDADDFLHVGAIFETIELMRQLNADVTINRYEFIREGARQSTGMNVIDRELWRDYLQKHRASPFKISQAPRFLQFTNYPWNKIIRTKHFQDLGLEPFFGETRVHNDVLGHWNILLHAERIVLVDKTIVTHQISSGRGHLSKKFGQERLDVFVALRSIEELLRTPNGPHRIAYPQEYWSFTRRLLTWARAKLQKNVRSEFDRQARAMVDGITFSELLSVQKYGDDGAYNWLMSKVT